MAIEPLGDRILVKIKEEGEVKFGSIIVPDTAKEKPGEGIIIAAGPGRVGDDGERIPLEVKVGERILFGQFSGTEVTVSNEEYTMMRESDILAVID